MSTVQICNVTASITVLAAIAHAQPDPNGIDFVTVGAPNNPTYQNFDPFGLVNGTGSVPYEYRIGRTEVTTGQWLEFFNTFKARPDPVPDSILPLPIILGRAG